MEVTIYAHLQNIAPPLPQEPILPTPQKPILILYVSILCTKNGIILDKLFECEGYLKPGATRRCVFGPRYESLPFPDFKSYSFHVKDEGEPLREKSRKDRAY